MQRFWSKVLKTDFCWEWQASKNAKGYGQFRLDGKLQLAHRVSFYFKHGRWPGNCLMHLCDNPPCVNPDHLNDGSVVLNNIDKLLKGRLPRGQKKHNAKLTDEMVRKIRSSSASGDELARQLGVSKWTIYKVRQNKTWNHVED